MRLARLARIVWAASRGYVPMPQIEDEEREAVAGAVPTRLRDDLRTGGRCRVLHQPPGRARPLTGQRREARLAALELPRSRVRRVELLEEVPRGAHLRLVPVARQLALALAALAVGCAVAFLGDLAIFTGEPTISACVESRPPETPITMRSPLVTCRRFFSP